MFYHSVLCFKIFWENTRNCVGIVNERTVSFFGPLPFRLENRLIFWFNFLTFGTSDGGWVVQFLNNYTKYAFFSLLLWCFTFFRYLCNAVREQRQPRTFFEMFEPLIKIFINLLITLQLWLLLSQPTFT